MIFFVVFVAGVLFQGIAGLLNGNVHSGTTSSPDGVVLHQTLGQLVVELEKRVNDLQNKVNALEIEKQNYFINTSKLETELSTQRLKLESLQRQQNASLVSLKTEEAFFRTFSSDLNNSLTKLTTDHENLKSSVDVMKNISILPMKSDIHSMQGHIFGILAAQRSLSGNLSHVQNDLYEHIHREKPGFTAYVDGTFDAPGTIILPHVYSNVGSLYDPQTGLFTADRTGLYGFYLGIECFGTGLKIVDLVKDGNKIAHAACSTPEDLFSYGSTFSVHLVEKGSKVWAKDAQATSIALRGKTTLSGFLLSN